MPPLAIRVLAGVVIGSVVAGAGIAYLGTPTITPTPEPERGGSFASESSNPDVGNGAATTTDNRPSLSDANAADDRAGASSSDPEAKTAPSPAAAADEDRGSAAPAPEDAPIVSPSEATPSEPRRSRKPRREPPSPVVEEDAGKPSAPASDDGGSIR